MARPDSRDHDLPVEFLRLLESRLEHQAQTIGQLLHDGAHQMLAAAFLTLAEVDADLPATASARLDVLRSQLAGVEQHLRQLAHELKPVSHGDSGLARMLDVLAAGARARYGLQVLIEHDLRHRLPEHLELVVFRVAQEALTNVARHARATEARVGVSADAHGVECSVRDNGVGFDVRSAAACAGLGLIGINEKLSLVGGHLHLVSAPGAGTELIASIPLERT